jgi:hypothetical protein
MVAKKVKVVEQTNMSEKSVMSSQVASKVKKVKSPNQKSTAASKKNWWLEPKDKIAECVQGVVNRIETAQSARYSSFVRFARMYGNSEAMGLLNSSNLTSNSETSNNRMRLNIIQSVEDACAAKIAKDRPKPFFITSGEEDFFARFRAEKLTKFVGGIFQQNKFYEVADTVFRDAELFGTGAVQWYVKNDKIVCDWVPTIELRVDDYDGMKHKPRSIHRVKMIAKEELIAEYPALADEIEHLNTEYLRNLPTPQQSVVEMIRVVESWHLPSRKDKSDGRHVLVVNDVPLKDEKYTKQYFPIVPYRWYEKPLGWYGRSITEEIYAIQIEINKLLWTAQNCFELVGIPLIFVENASEVSEDVLLSNFIARMVPYRGTEPHIVTPEPLPQQFFQHLNNHIQWAFQIVGLSQTSATSQNQLGPDASGAAIRELVDIETTRFVQVGKNWEDWFVKNAEVVVDMAKDLYEQDKEFSISYTYKKMIEKIKWKDCEIEDDFSVRCDPVSSLPDTAAGRMQTIGEYINQGWISPTRGKELMNIDPDLEEEINIQTAHLRNADKELSEIVEHGNYIHPNPLMMPPQMTEVLVESLAIYSSLLLQKCPDDRLQLVRDYIQEVQANIQAAMPPPPPPMPPQGMPPQGAPPQPPPQ